ncbi:hybrid sensor histidine kinase/response regulator transcription factor [Arcticibacter tournemirensis]|uniref:histidine kinase n=1 Tax=Arcticibacter tournemirensis TaxID=699437 RepID=A0A4Q0MGF9_9SPHI|nr:two-component regulator propeller domain-containing protein [Arcticibacter tournemirensis]RXF72435.1 response regulator [Arcticibacter tournemirensis]
MNKNLFEAIFTFATFFIFLQHGQAQQMQLSSIAANDKLPSNTVNHIFQDTDGYIWIGTPEGLSRYDAYRLLNIKPAAINRSRGSDNVTCIKEAGRFLLVGTDDGLQLLNKRTYRVSVFPDKRLQGKKIKCILIDRDGDIWIGTDGAVFVYHPDLTLKKIHSAKASGATGIPGAVSSIYEDSEGNIWLCFWTGGLYQYNKKKDSFIAFPKIGTNNNPFKIFQDNRRNYWLCTWGGGLFLFDPNESGSKMYSQVPVKNKRRENEKEELFYSVVQDDRFGYIWVMSFSGITVFEYTRTGDIKEVDVSGLFSTTSNIFSDIFKDRDGNLWIAAFGDGILTVNFNKPSLRNHRFNYIKDKYGISANFTMLYEETTGLMWFDMDRFGLGFFDPQKGRTILCKDIPNLSQLKALRSVSCALQRRQSEEVWVGSRYLPLVTVIRQKRGLPSVSNTIDLTTFYKGAGNPLSIFEDSRKNLWITTTEGLFVKPLDKNIFKLVSGISGYISGITEDKRGNIWISTAWNGLYQIFSPGNNLFPLKIIRFSKIKGITNTEISHITSDRQGKIWIASGAGKIWYYDPVEKKFLSYTATSISDRILDLTCDKYNNIWASTSRQIFRIAPFKSLTEYSKEDGLNVEMFVKNAYTQNAAGSKIYFGGASGICEFNALPQNDVAKDKHEVQITDVKVNNESALNNYNREVSFKPGTWVLNPEEGNLEIDFSSLNYEFPDKIKYAYKLEGVDADWIYPVKGRQFAVYNNLSKGSYTFLVKATGPDNIWHTDPFRFVIYKKPHYYETKLAYFIYASIIIALIYVALRFAAYRLKLRGDLRIAQIEKDKAEELAQTKISYFTGISHDFLTPLTIISCLIDDIQITTKRNLPQYEKMRSNVNRLKRLLQQILDFRRIESGNMQLKISKGEIVEFIREICVNHFMPLAKKKNIQFSVNASFSEPNAYFDADKIDKIIFNILSNAFKYTDEGGQVHVDLDMESCMIVKISDTGIGVSQEEQEKIFTPFYNNSLGRTESNGIGLSLTKTLVELHHGTIEVESELNKGSRFTLRIPVDQQSYSETELLNVTEIITEQTHQVFLPEDEEIKDMIQQGKDELNKLNLLLVDDNEDLLNTLKSTLSEYYNVFPAKNGLRALDTIKKEEIDIIVSDVMMPEMDGLQLCKKLKAEINTSHIPIILLTAKNSVDDRVECYNAGADGYVSKPFELKVLVARINNFIAQKKNRQSGFKSSYEINVSALEQPSIDEEFLTSAIKTIEKHLIETDFDVVALAGHLNMSRSTLYRKIKVLVGLSPNEFIKNIRLKHACRIMSKDKSISVSEVAFSTGFSDPRYFATCFKSEFGITPSEYQKGSGAGSKPD